MMVIPEQVKNQMDKGEVIEQEFKLKKRFSLKSYRAYTSNSRLFIEKSKRVTSIPYKSISSVNLKHDRRGYLIILGILHSLTGALIFWTKGEGYSLLMIPAGFLIIYSGYSRVQHIEINISGQLKSLRIEGQGEKLDSLLDLITRKKEAVDIKNG